MLDHQKERRIKPRFLVQDGIYAVLKPYSYKLGQIINISESGLAFSYLDYYNEVDPSHELDIFMLNNPFYISKIPFSIITDLTVKNDNFSSYITMKRCGLKFSDLTEEQISKINYFLNNFTLSSN